MSENSVPSKEVLAKELELPVSQLFARHLDNAEQWYPHQYVPWSEGRDYVPDEQWDPNEYPLPDGVRSALFVNLLTEDNLPYYTQTLLEVFGRDHPFRLWIQRWTAEENRHSGVMRSWIEIKRPIDPRALEDGRMAQMSLGMVPRPEDPMQGIAYVSFQELATRVAHSNTGRHLDPVGKKIMARVAGDEGLHYKFYADLAANMFKINPSAMMIAVAKQLRSFAMPGTGIINFEQHQRAIAEAGIYDAAKFKDKVAEPTLKDWGVWEMEGLTEEAKRARDKMHGRLQALGRISMSLNNANV